MNTFLTRLSKHHQGTALSLSIGIHAFALFGIAFTMPDPRNLANSLQPMQVVLVNSSSTTRPDRADVFAQRNLDGGGNTDLNKMAKSPLPTADEGKQFTPEQSSQRLQALELETHKLMTQLKARQAIDTNRNRQQQAVSKGGNDLADRSLEMARLEAQISKDYEAYQKLPRRKFVGARAQEVRYAQYVEAWRTKVERIGNMNYPQAARQKKVFGELLLTVSIRADGSVENIEVTRSAGPGKSLLDAAAVRIVKLGAPYSPLPPDIRRETDVLSITRTWTFTEDNTLESE